MAVILYNITNSVEFINIDSQDGLSSNSLRKSNITKFDKHIDTNTVGIIMVDGSDYQFDYRTLINPSTGLVFATIGACETYLEGLASDNSTLTAIENSTAYTDALFAENFDVAQAVAQLLPGKGSGWVTLKASKANSGTILIGTRLLDPDHSYVLDAGDILTVEHVILSELFAIASGANQAISIIGSTKSVTDFTPTTTPVPTTTPIPTTAAPTTTPVPTTAAPTTTPLPTTTP
jgi:hypothetical protein